MIIEVFVAQRQAIDSLLHQLSHAMLDLLWIAMVFETPGELPQNTRLLLDLVQQQPTRLGSDGPAVKSRYHFLPVGAGKCKAGLRTLCHSKGRSPLVSKHLLTQMFMPDRTAFRYFRGEKSGLADLTAEHHDVTRIHSHWEVP